MSGLLFGKLSTIVYGPSVAVPGALERGDRIIEPRIDRYIDIYCGSGSGSGSGSGGCHGEVLERLEREVAAEMDAPGVESASGEGHVH
ncbi:MAG TPA: hypothetical protein VEV17_01770 [Bryobacteraceae bacterium]|nr:hypothetical protein [Bryobacteraceae bacterium]